VLYALTLDCKDPYELGYKMSNENFFEMAKAGTLPADFTQWELEHEGISVAHVAAKFGHLPVVFDKWEIKDKDGFSVAHVAAGRGDLPGDFDKGS
jgi:hypothetical protein